MKLNYLYALVTVYLISCAITSGWLEPLLDQISRDRKVVACPVIDSIRGDDFSYLMAPGKWSVIGGFSWLLDFDWMYTPNYEYKRRGDDVSATW